MNHLFLFLVCILSIEAFLRFNFLQHLDSILITTKKVIHILPNKKISEHWKEIVIPSYAFNIMRLSLQILFILLCIILIFIIIDAIISGFLIFTLSLTGIIESIVFAFAYVYLRKLIVKNE